MIKIFIGHYINVFYSTADITLKKTTTAIFSKAYGILRRLNIFHRKFSLQHDEENK
ncbi:2-oxo acid dehydrogenase [Escherichia coli]|nr:2-oxo acid dehydrogenase [Escherichia coli]